jgi:hypothetical protein
VSPGPVGVVTQRAIGDKDSKLITAVVNRAELTGKPVKPVVILTDESLTALLRATKDVGATELILGNDRTDTPEAQLDKSVALWQALFNDPPTRLTVRVIGKDLDHRRDIAGGSQIPLAADDGGETARSLASTSSALRAFPPAGTPGRGEAGTPWSTCSPD